MPNANCRITLGVSTGLFPLRPKNDPVVVYNLLTSFRLDSSSVVLLWLTFGNFTCQRKTSAQE